MGKKGELEGVTRYGKALVNRQRAVLEDIFNEVREDPAYRAAARAQFIADPFGCASKLKALFGEDEKEGKGVNALNINNLYLQALQGAQQPAAPAVLELEAEELESSGTTRVHEPASDW